MFIVNLTSNIAGKLFFWTSEENKGWLVDPPHHLSELFSVGFPWYEALKISSVNCLGMCPVRGGGKPTSFVLWKSSSVINWCMVNDQSSWTVGGGGHRSAVGSWVGERCDKGGHSLQKMSLERSSCNARRKWTHSSRQNMKGWPSEVGKRVPVCNRKIFKYACRPAELHELYDLFRRVTSTASNVGEELWSW